MLVHEFQQEGPSDDNGHPHLPASSPPLPSTFSVPVVGPFCLLVAFRLPLPRLLFGRLGSVECVVCGTLTNDSPVPIPLISRGDETLRLGLRLRLFLGRILPHGASRSRAGHYVDVSDQSMVFQNSKSRIMRRSITPTTICCKVQTPPSLVLRVALGEVGDLSSLFLGAVLSLPPSLLGQDLARVCWP